MAHEYRCVVIERELDTTTIWMNLPERRNVLTLEHIEELTRAFSEAGESTATGVVLAAKGEVFCAGHDFSEMRDRDLENVRGLFISCTEMMDTMQSIPQPVIARVHALATGAGCQLVATADLAIVSIHASFCAPGGKGGLFCTTPMVAVGRAIERKRALEMALSGDVIDAATALSWGLVNQVVLDEELDEAVAVMLQRVTRGSSAAKAIGKRAFYAQIGMDQREAYDYAIEVMARASLTPDAQEGVDAFLEKRVPRWNQ